jgi:very-short-patch-repair endonuclease
VHARGPDAAVAALAERQHGVVSLAQLIACGLSERAVRRRVEAGRLHRIQRGVYAVGHRRLTRQGRWMAAVLAGGEGAVLSHRSAAALLAIRAYSGKPQLTTPRRHPRSAAFVAHRSQLQPDEITIIDAIPCTTVSRTLFDLAAILSSDELASAINEAELLGLTDATGLPALLERYPRRRGTRNLRDALAQSSYGTGHTKKELEARMKSLLFAANLPAPEWNATIELGEPTYEVDVRWGKQRLIAELDGWQSHRTRRQFERDRERDRRLTKAGYRVVRMTWRQLTPEAVADLAAMLRVRAP